jgi:protein-disulfide isomerase
MAAPRSPRPDRAAHGGGRRRRPRTSWMLAAATGALVVGGVVIAVSLLGARGDDDSTGGAEQTAVATAHLCGSGSVPVDGRTCGEEAAPVKIVELSDYQCPWCKRFVDTTEPEVESEYIQKGLVQLEFHNLAITGGNAPPDTNESTLAAEAAECANDQGRYWEYHYKLYAEQQGENRGAFLPERLKQFATDLGLDRSEFDACLDSHKHIGLIEGEREQSLEAGARATPSFLIDGKLVVGYEPFEKFREHIEEALAEQ